MKSINKYLLLLAAVLFSFTACEKSIEREPSPAFDGAKSVFFPVSSASREVDPKEEFSHSILIVRSGKEAAENVKINVVENTDDVFVVPEAVAFAAGQDSALLVVTFPNAQVDVAYTLVIALEDSVSNPYLVEKTTFSLTVNVAKWDDVTDKKGIVIDGITNIFYAVGTPGWYVSYQRKNNSDGSFDIRLLNPYTVLPEYEIVDGKPDYDAPIADKFGLYGGYPFNYPEDVDSEGTYNMVIHVAKNGKATFDTFPLGMIWKYGMFYGRHYAANGDGVWNAAEQSITFPGGSVLCAMEKYNDGGFYSGNEDMIIYLDAALYQDIHSAITVESLEDGFNDASLVWNPIEGKLSTLESGIQPGLIDVLFENVVDPNPEDKQGEGSDFFNLFRLADAYAEGFGLAFYWDSIKGKVSLPVSLQPTGLNFAGKDILVGPSAANECSVEDVVLQGVPVKKFHLFMQVQTEDGGNLGEYEEVFYFSTEEIIWGEKAEDFAGHYEMTGISPFDGSDVAIEVDFAIAEDKLFLVGIDYCSPIAVDFDDVNKTISIAPQVLDSIQAQYDITLFTIDATGSPSGSAPIVLSMAFGGILNLTDASPAVGYLIKSEVAGGWLDGAYNLQFKPKAAASAAPRRAASFAAKQHVSTQYKASKSQREWKVQGNVPAHNFRFMK